MNTNIDFFYEKYTLTNEQKERFEKYLELIQEYNKVMNLTGIDDKFGVYLKHFYDSLLVIDFIKDDNLKIGDLGSGAGFPGIVLAIYYPNNEFTLIEPLQKRCKFLETVIEELGLTNVKVLNKRAEELDHEQFDIVTSRAVAKLNILLELSIPLLKTGGKFIALKGANVEEEILTSKHAFNTLHSTLETKQKEIIPFEESTRYNLIIKKDKKTNAKYPRNFGKIKKSPL